jgi:hypothetical protein
MLTLILGLTLELILKLKDGLKDILKLGDIEIDGLILGEKELTVVLS